MKTLKDFNFQNKKVLLRNDFNVPLSEKSEILDDFRIKAGLPTINYLLEQGAAIILISHLGRPEGRETKFSLKPIAERLTKLLDKPVELLDEIVKKKIQPGQIAILENIRFYKEEEENDKKFAKKLADLADIYINDAFSASHREHASIVGIAKYLPSGMGFLIEKELANLDKILKNPEKPFVVIIGGKKVETKTKFIDKFSEMADFVLLGGLLPKEIEEQNIKLKHPEKVIMPIDWLDGTADIGEKTIELFKEKIKKARTIFWNGPLGKIEIEKYTKSSREISQAIVDSQAFSVVGGGETVEFITQLGLLDKFSFVSTGGGATLDYLVDGQLVGLDALK